MIFNDEFRYHGNDNKLKALERTKYGVVQPFFCNKCNMLFLQSRYDENNTVFFQNLSSANATTGRKRVTMVLETLEDKFYFKYVES